MKGVKKSGCRVQTVWSKYTQMKMEGTLKTWLTHTRGMRDFEYKNSKMQLCCRSFNKQWRLPLNTFYTQMKKVGRGWGRSKAVPLAREKIKHFYCVCHPTCHIWLHNHRWLFETTAFCACEEINHDEKGLRTFIETDNTRYLSLNKLLARFGGSHRYTTR